MERSDVETGTVLEIQGKNAIVITNKSKSCNECAKAEAGICGKKGAGMILKAKNSLGAVKGDTVVIDLANKTHIKAFFILFILPVITLFICAYTGFLISQSTGIQGLDVIAGLTGLVLSLVYSLIKIHKLDKSAQFHISRIIHTLPECKISSCPEEIDYLAGFGKNF